MKEVFLLTVSIAARVIATPVDNKAFIVAEGKNDHTVVIVGSLSLAFDLAFNARDREQLGDGPTESSHESFGEKEINGEATFIGLGELGKPGILKGMTTVDT